MTGTIDLNVLIPEIKKRLGWAAGKSQELLERPSRGYRAMLKATREKASAEEAGKQAALTGLLEWLEPVAVEQGERTSIKELQERLSTMISGWEPMSGYSPDYFRQHRVTGLGVQLATIVCDPGGCGSQYQPLLVGWKVLANSRSDSGLIEVLSPHDDTNEGWRLARVGAMEKAKVRADRALAQALDGGLPVRYPGPLEYPTKCIQ